MIIRKATYGNKEITQLIQEKVRNGNLTIPVNNNICGDPQVGVVKHLTVEYEIDGMVYTERLPEGTIMNIPRSKNNRLGIFYSNNHNPAIYSTIDKSLATIKKAAEGRADIITCVWNPIPNNPFTELISWYRSTSHLNQLLQVMQCLYFAKKVGTYEYVSFLEHDVLYPQEYFAYPNFPVGRVYCNMNYIGMNKDGFQALNQRDQPFHQMTMHFDDAIKHCESILSNALVTNSGNIENDSLIRTEWNSPHPAIHVNHGHHFTSHYNVYSKDRITKEHPYWGNHQQYLYLF